MPPAVESSQTAGLNSYGDRATFVYMTFCAVGRYKKARGGAKYPLGQKISQDGNVVFVRCLPVCWLVCSPLSGLQDNAMCVYT